jgi:hypothetical protein
VTGNHVESGAGSLTARILERSLFNNANEWKRIRLSLIVRSGRQVLAKDDRLVVAYISHRETGIADPFRSFMQNI